MDPKDPVVEFINQNYTPVDIAELAAADELSGLILYRRNDSSPSDGSVPVAEPR